MTIREMLKGKLTKKELEILPSSFDIIGNKDKAVAIIDIPEKLIRKKGMIARALMKKHKNVKSVLLKQSPRKGVYRTYDMKLISGDSNTEVMHVENGCRFLLDPRKVYFSQREATERQRIIEKIKDNENVMVFFAGIGPFAIEIAKKTKAGNVIGIEINPKAVDYFEKNVELNKIKNITIIEGDVRNEAKHFYGMCDRVLMPLPEKSIEFLDDAVKCLKKSGFCHMYCFSDENKIADAKKKIRAVARKNRIKIKFTGMQRVLPYGPAIYKYRVDFQVL
jgi:tRNA (guanine37-N1)-methyltransferase